MVSVYSCPYMYPLSTDIRSKQARVYEWSAELRLSGRVKIGSPGWIYVEGSSAAMETFTKVHISSF